MQYRHIDTAVLYDNHLAVGDAIRRSGLPRGEVFLTTKVGFFPSGLHAIWRWILDMHEGSAGISVAAGKGREQAALRAALQDLGVDQIDLCLLHSPFTGFLELLGAFLPHRLGRAKPFKWQPLRKISAPVRQLLQWVGGVFDMSPEAADVRRLSWEQLEAAQSDGLCRFIGVSNYDAALLAELAQAKVFPAVNQIEAHTIFQNRETRVYCEEHGVAVMAYGSSASADHNIVKELASARDVLVQHVALRWGIQSGMVVLAKSTRPARMRENLGCLNVTLSASEMETLDEADEAVPLFWDVKGARRTATKYEL